MYVIFVEFGSMSTTYCSFALNKTSITLMAYKTALQFDFYQIIKSHSKLFFDINKFDLIISDNK